MACEICGSTTKNPESAAHIKSKKHQEALKALEESGEAPPKEIKEAKPKKKKATKATKVKPDPDKDWLMMTMMKVFLGLLTAVVFTFLGAYLEFYNVVMLFVTFVLAMGSILLYLFVDQPNLVEPLYYALSGTIAYFAAVFVEEVQLFGIESGFSVMYYALVLTFIFFSIGYSIMFFNSERQQPIAKIGVPLGAIVGIVLLWLVATQYGNDENLVIGGFFAIFILLYLWFDLGKLNETSDEMPIYGAWLIYMDIFMAIPFMVNLFLQPRKAEISE